MFRGCIVALVTPFKRGKVDFDRLEHLVDFHVKSGTDAVVPCGTTGESPTLSFEEHEEVISRVVKRAAGRVPVMAGTGANSTSEAVMLTCFAEKAGADGALLVSPYYNKPEPDGMYRHFRRVCTAVKFPIVLYNIPSRTGRAIATETIVKLAKLKNVVAVKHATGTVEQAGEIMAACDIDILSGDDALTLPLLALGGTGVISVLANIVPRDISAMIAAFERGDIKKARRLHYKMLPLCKAIFAETNPIGIKAAMEMLGMDTGEMRLPMSGMRPENRKNLERAMRRYGLLKR